jgi:Tol biopolymer transport system component
MTGHDGFDRTLADWFEADALSAAPAGDLDRVLDATRSRRPRPAWLSGMGSDWVWEAPDAVSSPGLRSHPLRGVRWSMVLILLLAIAALVGGAILVGALLAWPSPLPTGRLGHLAYGLDGNILVADWDGRNPVRIAEGAPALDAGGNECGTFWGEEGRMWSPDGRHLAYRGDSCPTGASMVYVSDPEGHVVVSFPGTGWLVSWSPDSTRVATWVDLSKTIGIYGLDGGLQALLTVPTNCALPGDFDPVWSPDGRSVVVSPCEVPLDGRTPRPVSAPDPRSHFRVANSRDGARAAFIDYPNSTSLVIAKADGTELRVLAGARTLGNGGGPGAAYEQPVLSPTGDQVAFIWSPARYDQTSDPSLNTYELRVVDVASGTVTTLARASGAFPLTPLTFSPEGDRILFSRTEPNNVTSLWSVDADGSDARLLVPGSDSGDWQWQPGGS